MLKYFKKSPLGATIAALVFAILGGIAIYVMYNTVRTVTTFQSRNAIVTECHGSWGYTSARKSPRRRVFSYAPVATTDGGEQARGFKRLSRKSWCERLLGSQVAIYIHPDPKGKNVYGGFLDFWLFPAIILIVAGVALGRKRGAYIAVGGTTICAAFIAYEFSVFGMNKKIESELLTPIGKFQACINKHMADEGVTHTSDLKELLCYMPTDLDALWDMYSLENLQITEVDLQNLNTLPNFPNLKNLSLARIPNLSNFDGLSKFPKMETMLLHDLAFNSINDIPNLTNIKELKIWGNETLMNLDGIQRFTDLRELEIDRNAVSDISAIANLDNLVVFMGKSEPFTDISALANKPALRAARFSNTKVTDFTPLYGLPTLLYTGATGKSVPCAEMEKLRNNLHRKPVMWLPKHCK